MQRRSFVASVSFRGQASLRRRPFALSVRTAAAASISTAPAFDDGRGG